MRHSLFAGLAFTALAAPVLAQLAPAAPATPLQPLPRSSGPVRLGMPAQAFGRLAHVMPDCAPTENCGPHEARASGIVDTMPAGSGIPGMQQFTCQFVHDSLYAMTMRPPDTRLQVMRSYLTGRYGPPMREDTTEDGAGLVIWASKSTRLVLHYAREAKPNGTPAGTVTAVEYVDVRLAGDAEKDRGDKPWP